jgi:hypothetical protein
LAALRHLRNGGRRVRLEKAQNAPIKIIKHEYFII